MEPRAKRKKFHCKQPEIFCLLLLSLASSEDFSLYPGRTRKERGKAQRRSPSRTPNLSSGTRTRKKERGLSLSRAPTFFSSIHSLPLCLLSQRKVSSSSPSTPSSPYLPPSVSLNRNTSDIVLNASLSGRMRLEERDFAPEVYLHASLELERTEDTRFPLHAEKKKKKNKYKTEATPPSLNARSADTNAPLSLSLFHLLPSLPAKRTQNRATNPVQSTRW